MIAVVLTAHNRPYYLRQTLDSWSRVKGIEGISFSINLEPTSQQTDMLTVIEESAINAKVRVNPHRYGVLHNPWDAINHAFETDPEVTFVVLAEEDIVVSSDVLDFFKWAEDEFTSEEALTVSATGGNYSDPGIGWLTPYFCGLVWGTWRKSWEEDIRDTWDHDYSTHNGTSGVEAGWDWNLNTRVGPSLGKGGACSGVPRCKHIGREQGTHMSPSEFDSAQSSNPPGYKDEYPEVEFYRI